MIFIASAVWGVFLYNQTVNFKHEMKNISITLKQREVENAELKNILYSMVDLKESEAFKAACLSGVESLPGGLGNQKVSSWLNRLVVNKIGIIIYNHVYFLPPGIIKKLFRSIISTRHPQRKVF